jgi:hypothetical protein
LSSNETSKEKAHKALAQVRRTKTLISILSCSSHTTPAPPPTRPPPRRPRRAI